LNVEAKFVHVETGQMENAISQVMNPEVPEDMETACKALAEKLTGVSATQLHSKTTNGNVATGNPNIALLHIYRLPGIGAAFTFDVNLGAARIASLKGNSKTTVEIKTFGQNTLSAALKADPTAKNEVNINLEPGHEYYIRIDVGETAPILNVTHDNIGKAEFESIKK
jgi:hypothetical protein